MMMMMAMTMTMMMMTMTMMTGMMMVMVVVVVVMMMMTLLRSKRPQLLHLCPSEEQLKQRVGQLLGFGGAGQGAVAGRAANRHDHPLAQLLALLDALLDFRAAEEGRIFGGNAVFTMECEVEARKIIYEGEMTTVTFLMCYKGAEQQGGRRRR